MSIQEQKIDEGGKTVRRDKTTSATSHNRWRPNPYKTQMSYGSLILKTFKVWDMEIISALWMGRKLNREIGLSSELYLDVTSKLQSCSERQKAWFRATSWDLWRKGAARWLGIRVYRRAICRDIALERSNTEDKGRMGKIEVIRGGHRSKPIPRTPRQPRETIEL